MDWLLSWINIIGECLIMILLGEGYLAADGVVCDFDNVSGPEGEGLEFAIVFHFIAIPRITIGANEVIAMVDSSVAEIKVDFLDFI